MADGGPTSERSGMPKPKPGISVKGEGGSDSDSELQSSENADGGTKLEAEMSTGATFKHRK